MRKYNYALLCGALMLSLGACRSNAGDELSHHHHNGPEAHHNHGDAHEAEGHEAHNGGKGEGHSDEIFLAPEAAERFGVETEKLSRGEFADVIKVSGLVIESPTDMGVVSAPASGVITFVRGISLGSKIGRGTTIATIKTSSVSGGDANAAAKANYDAACRELDRLTPLYKERLVTASEYNAAVRAVDEAKALYSAGAQSGRATSPLSGVITSLDVNEGQFVAAGEPIATVSANSSLTLRADVPERYYGRLGAVSDATVKLPYDEQTVRLSEIGGHRVSNGEGVRAATPGYVPVYFSFNNDGRVLPGSNVEIYLEAGRRDGVIAVPLEALSEQQGRFFVFVKLDEEGYRKIPVTTGASDGRRVEIVSGLNDGDEVVTKGATTVRIAESSGTVPEGHSHNH